MAGERARARLAAACGVRGRGGGLNGCSGQGSAPDWGGAAGTERRGSRPGTAAGAGARRERRRTRRYAGRARRRRGRGSGQTPVPSDGPAPRLPPPWAGRPTEGAHGMTVRQFGHYELESLIGVGGMGEVWRATDTRRDRTVALKLLPEALGNDTDFLNRFRRESHVAARLREPHVVPIHDYGEIDGRLFIDMRLVDGRDLGEILKDGPIAPTRTIALIAQVADALE